MSIGNLKTEGNKGTNYPYQHNVLKGLQKALEELQQIIANTAPVSGLATEATLNTLLGDFNAEDFATETTLGGVFTRLAAANRTPNFIRVIDSGTINVITYSLSVANVGTDDGTFLGSVIKPGEIINFDAGSLNNIYAPGSFTYDATGTEFMITYNS
jgi:hypothetical protein